MCAYMQGDMCSADDVVLRRNCETGLEPGRVQVVTSVHSLDTNLVSLFRLEMLVSDFNETRPSDVYVVNFGPHYHGNPDGDGSDDEFRPHMSAVLDAMGKVADVATVVWRWVLMRWIQL